MYLLIRWLGGQVQMPIDLVGLGEKCKGGLGAVVPGTMARLLALAPLRSASPPTESTLKLGSESAPNRHSSVRSKFDRSFRSVPLRGNCGVDSCGVVSARAIARGAIWKQLDHS